MKAVIVPGLRITESRHFRCPRYEDSSFVNIGLMRKDFGRRVLNVMEGFIIQIIWEKTATKQKYPWTGHWTGPFKSCINSIFSLEPSVNNGCVTFIWPAGVCVLKQWYLGRLRSPTKKASGTLRQSESIFADGLVLKRIARTKHLSEEMLNFDLHLIILVNEEAMPKIEKRFRSESHLYHQKLEEPS